jgi:hypothetical protein
MEKQKNKLKSSQEKKKMTKRRIRQKGGEKKL